MKIALLFITLFTVNNAFAQLKKVNGIGGLDIKEKYYVLKANPDIKEGEYTATAYTSFENTVICKGFYKNNLKDSLWIYYARNGKAVESGYYKEGKKTGVWACLDNNGEPEVKYDFTANQLLFFKPNPNDTSKKFGVINGMDTLKMHLDRPPIYLDGNGRMQREVSIGLRYPATARDHNAQGKVIVAFTIDKNGATSNYRIKQSVGYGCDEEAMKAVKRITGDWLPGLLNGNQVTVEYEIPMAFSLSR